MFLGRTFGSLGQLHLKFGAKVLEDEGQSTRRMKQNHYWSLFIPHYVFIANGLDINKKRVKRTIFTVRSTTIEYWFLECAVIHNVELLPPPFY